MLREDDLVRFQDHFRAEPSQVAVDPASALQCKDGLFSEEIWRLAQSLQISSVLGDADRREAAAATVICQRVRDIRCVDLDHSDAWRQAIAWTLAQPTSIAPGIPVVGFADRSERVGQACRRLRERGYEVSVSAYGVLVSDQSCRTIAERIDELVAHLGGVETTMQVCRIIEDSKLIYDGMWLLGNRVSSIWSPKQPAFPVGWLFSVGLRHLGSGGKARKPAVVWKTIAELATDFAAAVDCQRYNQFEEINISAASSWRVLRDSLLWREIFVLPQVPPQVIPALREAFVAMVTPDEEAAFDWRFRDAFDELNDLLRRSVIHKLTLRPRAAMARAYPNLWKVGVGELGKVNSGYVSPTAGGARNQSSFIFFTRDKNNVLTLPAPLLREAFCQAAFAQIWTKLKPDRAKRLVGKIFERVLEQACQGKAAHVYPSATYKVGKKTFEIDVATRDGDRIVMFETKAKSLTAQARSGDMMAFYADYTASYLTIVKQLVRHEDYLRQGLTPLSVTGEVCHDFRPLKVAVSPLSYGPSSDKVLANGLLRCFANVALSPVSKDAAAQKTTDDFNKAVRQIYAVVPKLAPKDNNGVTNIFAYFLDLFWLDLGQVLYVLDRANSVVDAFTPLQYVTFTTRDFWTEVAFADTQGLMKDRWRPLPR